MKFPAALLLCAAALIPPVALADAPHTPLEVGMMQAVFDFCSKADPVMDGRLALKARALDDNLSEHDRNDLRNNVGYKQGYGIMQSLLDKVRKADARRGCEELFSSPKLPQHKK